MAVGDIPVCGVCGHLVWGGAPHPHCATPAPMIVLVDPTITAMDKNDHTDAWNVAHHRRDESNLARCYIELREKAQAAVDAYYVASGKVIIDGQDGYDPLRALRIICESNGV